MKLLPNFEGIAGGMRRRPWATGEVISDPEASSEQNRMSREELRTAANRATEVEKNMSASVCFWAFRRAAIQSLLLSFACVMEGYGLVLITGFFTFPEFRHTFSCPERPHALIYENCEIDPAWQMGLVLAPMAGQMVGVVVNGWVTEKIGFKKTFLASMVSLTGLIAMIVFATSKWMLFVGLLLCGVPWGVFQTLTTNYASDVCMTPIRAYVTGWTNVAWIVGQLIGAIVQSKMVNVTTEWSYRFPLVLQYIFPIPIFLAALFAQESPWWLVRKSKLEKARKVLVKLSHKKSAPAKYSVDDHLALIQVTNEEELVDSKNGGGTGYGDCFKGVNLRRTEITTLAWVTQNACGSALMAWSPYFFEKAGMARDVAWTFVIVQVRILSSPLYIIFYHPRNIY